MFSWIRLFRFSKGSKWCSYGFRGNADDKFNWHRDKINAQYANVMNDINEVAAIDMSISIKADDK